MAVEGGQMHEDADEDRRSACAAERLETKKAGDLSQEFRDATDKPSCIKTIQPAGRRAIFADVSGTELNANEGELLLKRCTS